MKKRGKTDRGQVRIIGGQYKGHRLQFVDQRGDLRPSSDRIRETLFNWLQFDLPGSRVLDAFAGSGALGAEALSRGAGSAVLVEKKRPRCDDLRRQLTPLFQDRVQVQCDDALHWLARASGSFDLVFVDPPYDLGLSAAACQALEECNLLADEAWVYLESRSHDPAPQVPAHWQLHREKAGGDIRAQLYYRAR